MDSPPATPPARIPLNPKRWRFKNTSAECEWVERYRPGGFHPVSLGDTFHDGVYRVIRKLGEGSFSTVWLCVDTRTSRYVALKIMGAEYSGSNTELSILNHLSAQARQDSNSRHLTVLLDTFVHEGPNGTHRCLVFEPMGDTAASFVDWVPRRKPKQDYQPLRYPVWMAKQILLHTLRGLAFLHSNGVVHADVQQGNILFAMGDLSGVAEGDLAQIESKNTVFPVERRDGKVDLWAPKHLYLGQSLHEYVKLDPSSLHVKLSDLGSAFWEAEPPSDTVTPDGLRAPEIILQRKPYTSAIDIWSFGCLIFEILTGELLFTLMTTGQKQDGIDDEHLLQLNDIIRPLPDDIMAAWSRASVWFGPERQRLDPYSEDGEVSVDEPLEAFFNENKPDEIDNAEVAAVCALIRRVLVYDPAKRPTAKELLEDPWFSDIRTVRKALRPLN